jgi:hypothetical protein
MVWASRTPLAGNFDHTLAPNSGCLRCHCPTTTVGQWHNGETILRTIKDADLDYWLKEYSLGALFKSGELEQMA